MRFVARILSVWLDYPVALALVAPPLLLGLGGSNPLGLRISPVVGLAAFALTVFTDHHLGMARARPCRLRPLPSGRAGPMWRSSSRRRRLAC